MSQPLDPRPAWRARTLAVHGGHERSPHGETSEALYLTSGFVYDDAETAEARFKGEASGYVYSRYGNPTIATFERRMALIEGAEDARGLASGMAAVFFSLMAMLKAGDHLVASRALFGSCDHIIRQFLPRYGIASTVVDGTDLAAWQAAMRPETRAVFLETPSNPTLEIIDLPAVAAIAHRAGARVVVDNVFATPVLQRPLELGADVVVYSATKHIDGQGRCLGGVILGGRRYIEDELMAFMRHAGPALSPFNAWVMLKGLETLELRVRAQAATAAAVAEFLATRAGVTRAIFPTLANHPQRALAARQMAAGGTVVSCEVAGGKAAAFRVLNALRIFRISNNLGDAKSLVTHPATTTHARIAPEDRARLGIGEGLIRLSIGLEDPADLIADLDAALAAA